MQLRGYGMKGLKYSITLVLQERLMLLALKTVKSTYSMSKWKVKIQTYQVEHQLKRNSEYSLLSLILLLVSFRWLSIGNNMEGTTLNMILVFSFLFVSIALGVKWIGEIIIQIILSRQGLEMQKEELNKLFEALEEEIDDEER